MTRPTATIVMPPIMLMIIHRVMLDMLVAGTGVVLPYLGLKTPVRNCHLFTPRELKEVLSKLYKP